MTGFKHKTPIQVRFKDIDALGHVNNANHLSYIELARVHYFNDAVGMNINWSEEGIILAKATIDYKMPILLNDKVFVYTRCSRTGNKSFDLEYAVVKEENGKDVLLATATTVMVCFNYRTGSTMLLKEEWKNKMLDYEKQP
ncbi:MAG TPA: thioesterase family protein [Bacteroidia bacterium]|jgi:acyl-CoA thioester hydrolase